MLQKRNIFFNQISIKGIELACEVNKYGKQRNKQKQIMKTSAITKKLLSSQRSTAARHSRPPALCCCARFYFAPPEHLRHRTQQYAVHIHCGANMHNCHHGAEIPLPTTINVINRVHICSQIY